MCGFLGVFKKKNINSSFACDEKLLAHRGPDEESFLVDKNYALAFWRLSIVDASKGQQPMEDKKSGIKILFNGEIYNYRNIKKILISKGYLFETNSDTEVAIKAYLAWGLNAFEKFEGMFSICIIDSKKNEICLVRDRMGVKPLYYAYHNSDLIVASEQKAIIKTINVSPKINKNSLRDYLLYQSVLGKETLFKGIYKVPKGTIMTFDLSNQELIYTQEIGTTKKDEDFQNYTDYKKALRSLIIKETKDALDTDLDITFQLSGGIDSNLILGIARKFFPDKKKFSVSSVIEGNFDDDEEKYIKKSVKHFATEHKIIEISSKNFFNNLEDSIEFLDEPAGDPGVVAQFIVNKEISKYSKIGVAGQGADELFFGYMRNFITYIKDSKKKSLLSSEFFDGWEDYLLSFELENEISSRLIYFQKMRRFNIYEGSDENIKSLNEKLVEKSLKDFNEISKRSNSLNIFMLNTELDIQLQALLQMEDRSSMRHSVETRVPFCTSSILNLASQGSIDWKFEGGFPKGILRDSFKDLIPSHILSRKKKVGRPIPLKKWLTEDSHGKDYLNLLDENKELINSLFGANILSYAFNHPNLYDRTIWALLSMILWIRKYKVSF